MPGQEPQQLSDLPVDDEDEVPVFAQLIGAAPGIMSLDSHDEDLDDPSTDQNYLYDIRCRPVKVKP